MDEVQGLADLLVEGVWYAFAAGSIFGTFVLGPFVVEMWDRYCERRDQKARWEEWSAS